MKFSSGYTVPELNLLPGHVHHDKRSGRILKFKGGMAMRQENWELIAQAGKQYIHSLKNDPRDLRPEDAGRIWYNEIEEKLKRWNGTAIEVVEKLEEEAAPVAAVMAPPQPVPQPAATPGAKRSARMR